jgi:hypothetical protein
LYFIVFPKQSVVQGTTFVLQKSADARQMLLSTISAGTGVEEVCHCILHHPLSYQMKKGLCTTFSSFFARQVINDFVSSQNKSEVDLDILVGEWQLLWRSQVARVLTELNFHNIYLHTFRSPKVFSLFWVQTEGESWSSVASAGLKDFQVSFRTKSSLAK